MLTFLKSIHYSLITSLSKRVGRQNIKVNFPDPHPNAIPKTILSLLKKTKKKYQNTVEIYTQFCKNDVLLQKLHSFIDLSISMSLLNIKYIHLIDYIDTK